MDHRVRRGGDTQCEGVVRSSGIQSFWLAEGRDPTNAMKRAVVV
jgi:hypothetical protein